MLLKIAGAGACHAGIVLFEQFDESMGEQLAPSYTHGHKNAGWVEELGEGVTGLTVGDAYLAYEPIGCGQCPACSCGQDT